MKSYKKIRKFIPVSEPNLSEIEREYLIDAFDSTWISSNGMYLEKFKKLLSRYLDIPYIVLTSSGTTALHTALLAAGIKKGDEVIVPDLTYIATANAVTYIGATPVFADVLKDTWTISPESVEKLISKKTKAIICVHLYGNPCDMDKLLKIAKNNNIFLIEDTAEALGSIYKGKKVGTFGDVSVFSFYGNKTITTGEGGAIATRNKNFAQKSLLLRGQGMSFNRRYWFEVVGYNYRMTNLQAAIGCGQMRRIDELIAKKFRNANLYYKYLEGKIDNLILHKKLFSEKEMKSTYWMFSVIVKDFNLKKRDLLIEKLLKKGIETRPFFYPISSMPPYKKSKKDENKNCYYLFERGINLPSSTLLTEEEIKFISKTLIETIKELRNLR